MASKVRYPHLPSFEVKQALTGAVDTDVVFVFQSGDSQRDDKKTPVLTGAYAPLLEKFGKGEVFAGKMGQTSFIRFGGKGHAQNVYLIGLGAPSGISLEKVRLAAGNAWARLKAEKAKTFSVNCDAFLEARGLAAGITPHLVARSFAEGLMLSAYEFGKYKSTAAKTKVGEASAHICLVAADKTLKKHLEEDLNYITSLGEALTVARDWSNEPSNIGTPEYFAAQAQKLAREYVLKCKVLSERDAAREKMNLFLAVGQGSEREGKVVVLEYTPKDPKVAKNAKTIAYVGKGVTFDSGGISIKPAMRMEDMKHDMSGASTIMGGILLAAKLKVPNRVIAILAFTENMPSGTAVQPGNIITARNGKTVEILNTDAEGRLVLADVLDYAHDFKPDAIVNLATLTGAATIALGKHCSGIMTNNEKLADQLVAVGQANGERMWPLPMWDEYLDDMKSEVADLRNVCNETGAGTIRGGIFLKQFIKPGTAWAHLDIATTANGISHISYYPRRGATGMYVRTLARFAAEF